MKKNGMTKRVFSFLLAMVMLLSAGIRLSAGNDLVFYNANIVDTDKGEVQYNQTVTVRNGLIVSSEPSAARVRPGEMDMTGKFLVPGLIDSHVHYANACRDASSAKSLSELFLKNGVTTVRDVGGNYLFIKEYDRMRQSGELAGPKFITALFGQNILLQCRQYMLWELILKTILGAGCSV